MKASCLVKEARHKGHTVHASIYMKMGKRGASRETELRGCETVAEGLPGAGESAEWRVTAYGYGACF